MQCNAKGIQGIHTKLIQFYIGVVSQVTTQAMQCNRNHELGTFKCSQDIVVSQPRVTEAKETKKITISSD